MSRICVLISDSFPFWCQLLRSGSKFQFDWDFMDLVTQSYWIQWLHSWVNNFLYESPWKTMKITSNIIISMSGIHSQWFWKHIVFNLWIFNEVLVTHQILNHECLEFAFWSVIQFRSDASCFDPDSNLNLKAISLIWWSNHIQFNSCIVRGPALAAFGSPRILSPPAPSCFWEPEPEPQPEPELELR